MFAASGGTTVWRFLLRRHDFPSGRGVGVGVFCWLMRRGVRVSWVRFSRSRSATGCGRLVAGPGCARKFPGSGLKRLQGCGAGGSSRRTPSGMTPDAGAGRCGSGKANHHHTPNGRGTGCRGGRAGRGPGLPRLRMDRHDEDVDVRVRGGQPRSGQNGAPRRRTCGAGAGGALYATAVNDTIVAPGAAYCRLLRQGCAASTPGVPRWRVRCRSRGTAASLWTRCSRTRTPGCRSCAP